MKRFLSLVALAVWASGALAVPAKRVTRTITLSDGSCVTVTLTGDENQHYYCDAQGTRYELQDDGRYVALTAAQATTRAMRANMRATDSDIRRKASLQRRTDALTGEKRGLVILANFQDKQMTLTQSEFNDAFNKTGYSENGSIGSVRDYFMAQSYNQLVINFDVVGPVQLQKEMSYYGKNDAYGNDLRPAEMVIEAIKAVDSQVDFADYDWDGDGLVDQVYVIYAGYGEAQGASANTVWPHEWDLYSAQQYGDGSGPQTMDGVFVNTYACSNELYGTSGKTMDGIGTACHEFSHCLGLPDLYDTGGGNNYGMGFWDLMCAGNYNGNGYVPAGYSSYERMAAGWLKPVEIKDYTQVSALAALNEKAEAYIIYNQANRNEYYLLENRQLTEWDSQLAAAGMLVLHVDYDENAWLNNTVNNTASRQRMTIIPADGMCSENTEKRDTWPQANSTELTNKSYPAAKLYNANADGTKFLNMPIRNITRNADGTIAFTAGEPDTDAIALPTISSDSDAPIYDLSGRRVQETRHGIHIQGNRKIFQQTPSR